MNYKQLLLKYINHVGLSEGTTFLQNHDRNGLASDVEFTDEEWAALQELGKVDYRNEFVGHACSCHARNEGPCLVCKTLACEVFDFNQVAQPRYSEHPVQLDGSENYNRLYVGDHNTPMFTDPETFGFKPPKEEDDD